MSIDTHQNQMQKIPTTRYISDQKSLKSVYLNVIYIMQRDIQIINIQILSIHREAMLHEMLISIPLYMSCPRYDYLQEDRQHYYWTLHLFVNNLKFCLYNALRKKYFHSLRILLIFHLELISIWSYSQELPKSPPQRIQTNLDLAGHAWRHPTNSNSLRCSLFRMLSSFKKNKTMIVLFQR